MICAIAEHSIFYIACCVSAMKHLMYMREKIISLSIFLTFSRKKKVHATANLKTKKRSNLSVLTAFYISLHCLFLVLAFDLFFYFYITCTCILFQSFRIIFTILEYAEDNKSTSRYLKLYWKMQSHSLC